MRLTPRGIERGLPPRFKVKSDKWYPCPGFIKDPVPGSQERKRFDKWHKRLTKVRSLGRPDPSRIFWRMHPEAYAKMTDGKTPW